MCSYESPSFFTYVYPETKATEVKFPALKNSYLCTAGITGGYPKKYTVCIYACFHTWAPTIYLAIAIRSIAIALFSQSLGVYLAREFSSKRTRTQLAS